MKAEDEEKILSIIKETTFENVFEWIKEAFLKISKNPAMITKAFTKCKLIEQLHESVNDNADAAMEDIRRLFETNSLN